MFFSKDVSIWKDAVQSFVSSLPQQDLQEQTGANVKNIIYVVSDGIETCNGDPVKAAKQLNQSDIKGIVNIIGFDVDNEGQASLKKVAGSGKC